MAILNLSGQQLEYNDLAPKLNKLKTLMDERLPIWEKISINKKVKWIKSDKDSRKWASFYKHQFYAGSAGY